MIALIGILTMLFLNGCCNQEEKILTNDELITECKKCEDSGMIPIYSTLWGDSGMVIKVTCYPKEKK